MKLSDVQLKNGINILCHDGEAVEVTNDRDDVVTITADACHVFGAAVTTETWARLQQSKSFMQQFRCVFPELALRPSLQEHTRSVQQVVGLICLTQLARKYGLIPFWRTPEDGLHPRAQLGLADLAILLSKPVKGEQ